MEKNKTKKKARESVRQLYPVSSVKERQHQEKQQSNLSTQKHTTLVCLFLV